MSEVLRMQPLVRSRLVGLGELGEAWLDALPGVLADLADRWGLELGRGLPGGSTAYVVGARTAGGAARVVKVGLPGTREALAHEAAVLRAAEGRGYVRLHDHDAERGALLLEALGPSLERAMLGPDRTLDVLADLLRRVWTLPRDAATADPRSRAEVLAELVADGDRRHPGVADPAVVDHVRGLAAHLAATDDPARRVPCHGDPHPANALRRGDGWALVDPDGVLADPAYDAGVVLREWLGRLERSDDPRTLLARWSRRLGDRTGLDADRVAAWGLLARVSTGFHVLDLGAEAMGRRFLDSALPLVGPPG